MDALKWSGKVGEMDTEEEQIDPEQIGIGWKPYTRDRRTLSLPQRFYMVFFSIFRKNPAKSKLESGKVLDKPVIPINHL